MSLLPSKKIEKEFQEFNNEFIEFHVSKEQVDIVNKVNEILNILNLGDELNTEETGFLSWNGDKLTNARAKLARYSELLNNYMTYHESRSDFAYIYRKGAYAEDWLPMKTEMSKIVKKLTNPEIDNELVSKYLGEQYYSMFHRRRADYLNRKVDAIDKMIRTIKDRLYDLNRQNDVSNV